MAKRQVTSGESPELNFDKVWLLFQETNQKFQETGKKIKELASLFTGQWGNLVEALYKVYGAIAAIRFEEDSDKYAMHQGIFVLSPSGENLVRIDNEKGFRPKTF